MILPPAEMLEFCPDFRSFDTSWQGLAPVAAWLMHAARPRRVVDLGAGAGDSTFTLQQAAQDLPEVVEIWAIRPGTAAAGRARKAARLPACFAAELALRADPRLRVVQLRITEAATAFAAASVDLLHVGDGFDAATLRALIAAWQPVLAPDAILALNGIAAPDPECGARAVWREIVAANPGRTFAAVHSGGLGLWCLGKAVRHEFHHLAALAPGAARVTQSALALAGGRIAALTAFEARLCAEAGQGITGSHALARGEARARLMAYQALAGLGRGAANHGLDLLQADLAAVPVAAGAEPVAPSPPLGGPRITDIWTEPEPRLQAMVTAGPAPWPPGGTAAGPVGRRRSNADPVACLEPLVRQIVKHKNDVQDDAIIGIGAKVDAHEEAIQGLAEHIRKLLAHPIFRR